MNHLAGTGCPPYGIYSDADVLKKLPHYKDALPVVQAARGRPMSDRYGEVSDALRTTTNAMLAGTMKPADGVAEIDNKLRRVMR